MGTCGFCMIFAIVALMSVIQVYGQNCANISGAWYNQLGSEMILQTDSTDGHQLLGEYRTAVEREGGSAGKSYSNIIGLAPEAHVPGQQSPSVFGFSVLWSGGNSSTTWLAQCLVCDGVERIVTTWILRSRVESCTDKWRAVMTGRDHFTRQEQRAGSRAHRNTHTPLDHRRHRNRGKRDLSYTKSGGFQNVEAPNIRTSINVVQAKPLDVDVDVNVVNPTGNTDEFRKDEPGVSSPVSGLWYNELGSEMNLYQGATTTITGSYKTVTERMHRRRQNNSHSEILGVGNPSKRDSTLSLLMSWNNGESITAWVGQAHLCTDTNRPDEVLEAAFLHRSRIDHCHAEWKSTIHGHTSFRRADPFENGGEQIAVREFGEEETLC